MLTGLFMSCFLIGTLWFVIGIGDTLVYRDMMQEAVDHGAFSAAALNAKGMNFIALLNLIMLAATVLYIGLGILTDVAGAAYSICLASILCDPYAPALYRAWSGAYSLWNGYFTGYKYALKALYGAETAAGYIYPLAGSAAAFKVGGNYNTDSTRRGGPTVIAFSAGMVPGGVVRALPGGSGAHKATLLPLEPKKHDGLCEEILAKTGTGLSNFIGGGGKAIRKVSSLIGSVIKERYCNKGSFIIPVVFIFEDPHWWAPWPESGHGPGTNESFWDEKGYYVVYGGAENGNLWMQTYALAMSTPEHDRSDGKVKMASLKPGSSVSRQVEESGTYLAQAEIYFNCKDKWGDNNCNYKDNAMFDINWRARLRRLDQPSIIGSLVGSALNSLENGPPDSARAEAGNIVEYLTEKISETLGAGLISRSIIGQVLDGVQEKVNEVIGSAAGGLDPSIPGIYH
jgi:hypothetical protein